MYTLLLQLSLSVNVPYLSFLLANSRVKRCRTDDLMPNVPISCLPSSCVDSGYRSSTTEDHYRLSLAR